MCLMITCEVRGFASSKRYPPAPWCTIGGCVRCQNSYPMCMFAFDGVLLFEGVASFGKQPQFR